MKKSAFIFFVILTAFSVPLFAQPANLCQTTQLNEGTKVTITTEWQKTGTVGSDYEYELWHNADESKNSVSMTVYGANQGGGAAFRGDWNEPNTKFDYLARIGYKFEKNGNGSGKLYTEYDPIYADYNYARSGRLNGDNYSYIGIYGWARAGSGANLVEFYIVDDWWGNRHQGDDSPVTKSTTGGDVVTTATIDGAAYQIIKNSRQGQPSIEGNSSNFDQYFSVRQTPRKCGTISITEHFKAWEKAGLKLGKLYEAKILAEVGAYGASTTTGYIDYRYAAMRMGGGSSSSASPSSSSSRPSSSSVAPSSSSRPSSSSVAASSSSRISSSSRASSSSSAISSSSRSSSSAGVSSSSTATSSSSSSSSASSSSSEAETSSSSSEESTPIKTLNAAPSAKFQVRFLSNRALLVESPANAAVYLYNANGNLVQKISVPAGSSMAELSVPAGIYVVKNAKTGQTQRVLAR